MKLYFEINKTPDSSPQTVWEFYKAHIRGIFVKLGTQIKKIREKRFTEIMDRIRELDRRHKSHSSKGTLQELTKLRAKLRDVYQENASAIILRNKREFYEFGNKSIRMLAQSLCQHRKNSFIPSIKMGSGETFIPKEIAEEF